ncbi:MAG: hypothetical protein K8U57_35880 [Planctomycetes bacterium]|nr:hypothetical protein [Planctomycetota bacterium]
MASISNTHNEYAAALDELFDKVPKAVLAAIAVSALTRGGDQLSEAKALLAKEWEILNLNGIVPQRPCKEAKAAMRQGEAA